MVVGVEPQLEAYPFKSTKKCARYKTYNVRQSWHIGGELKKIKTLSPVLVT